jgi:hypothetical protein
MGFQHLDFTITSIAAGKLPLPLPFSPALLQVMDGIPVQDFTVSFIAADKLSLHFSRGAIRVLDFPISSIGAN